MLRLRREEAYGGALARGWQRMSEAIISAEIGWVSHSGHDGCSLCALGSLKQWPKSHDDINAYFRLATLCQLIWQSTRAKLASDFA
jgi:hypothetical protein